MASHTLLTLKYPAVCAECETELSPGTKAWWDPESRRATCLACGVPDPEDLYIVSRSTRRDVPVGSAVEQDRRAPRRSQTGAARSDAAGAGHRLAAFLRHHESDRFVVLDDRANPDSRAGSDHVAVAATGVYVIDTESRDGKPRRKIRGCWPWRSERLIVDGEDFTHVTHGMARRTYLVAATLGRLDRSGDVPVVPVVCLVGSDMDRDERVVVVNGVRVVLPHPLQQMLRAEGPLSAEDRRRLAMLLSGQLAHPPAFGR